MPSNKCPVDRMLSCTHRGATYCTGADTCGVDIGGFKATESPTPLGQTELACYKSHIKAVAAIRWRCDYCGLHNYGEDTLRRPEDTADLVKTDNILCERCDTPNDIYMDL